MSYTPDNLCFTGRAASNSFYLDGSQASTALNAEYSYDTPDGPWISFDYLDVIPIAQNQSVYLHGENSSYLGQFVMTGSIEASGDICTMYRWDRELMPSGYSLMFGLFQDCTALTKAPYFRSSFTHPVGDCCRFMYDGCTNLTEMPELPFTYIERDCCANMFSGCTSLVTVHDIIADTIEGGCSYMFQGCTSLTAAPHILATSLINDRGTPACQYMFEGCTNLTTPSLLHATTIGNYCCEYMYENTQVKLSWNQTSVYKYQYRIPHSGTATIGNGSLYNYAYDVSGYRLTPNINTTYYTQYPASGLYVPNYFYMYNSNRSGTSRITYQRGAGSLNKPLEYSNDQITWYTWNPNNYIGLAAYSTVYIRGNYPGGINVGTGSYMYFNGPADNSIYLGGDINTLLSYTEKITSIPAYCFYKMFSAGYKLLSTLKMPATTVGNSAYFGMFKGANGVFPALPATTLGANCYSGMFENFGSNTQTPNLPATTIPYAAYANMFKNAYNVTSAGDISGTTVADYGCQYMFYGTRITNTPKLDFTSIGHYGCQGMFQSTKITRLPILNARTYGAYACAAMFYSCTQIKLSQTYDATNYPFRWIISENISSPSSGSYAFNAMFTSTGGSFVGTPVIQTVYYANSLPVTDYYFSESTNTGDTTGQCVHRIIGATTYPNTCTVNATLTCNGSTETLTGLACAQGTQINFVGTYSTNSAFSITYTIYDGSTALAAYTINGNVPAPTIPTVSATHTAFSASINVSAPSLNGDYIIDFTCAPTAGGSSQTSSRSWPYGSALVQNFSGLTPDTNYTLTYQIKDNGASTYFYTNSLTFTTDSFATLTYNLSTCHTGTFTLSVNDTSQEYDVIFDLLLDDNSYATSTMITTTSHVAQWTTNLCMPRLISGSHTYKIQAEIYSSGSVLTTLQTTYTPISYNLIDNHVSAVGRVATLNFSQNSEQQHILTIDGTATTLPIGQTTFDITQTGALYNTAYSALCVVTYNNYTIYTGNKEYTTGQVGTFSHSAYQNKIDVWLSTLTITGGDAQYVKYSWKLSDSSIIIDTAIVQITPTDPYPALHTIPNLIPEHSYDISWTVYAADGTTILQPQQTTTIATSEFVINRFVISAKGYTSLTTDIDYTAADDNFEIDYYIDGTLTESHAITSRSGETYQHNGFVTNTQHTIQAKVYYIYGGIRYLVETSPIRTDTTNAAVNWINDRRSSKISFYTNVASYYAAVSTAVWTFNGTEYPAVTLDPTDTRIGYIEFTGLTPETIYQYSIQYFTTGGLYVGSDSGSISTTSISADFAQLLPRQSYNSVIVQISNIDYDVSGLYVKYRLNSTYSEAIAVVDNAADPYTFTGLTGGNTYAIHAYIYTDQACTHQVGHLESTAQTGHAAEVSYSATSNSAQVWMIPTNLQVASGYATWTIGTTTLGTAFTNTQSQPGLSTFTGLSRNTQYNYTLRIYTERDGTLLDTITGSFRTLNYVGSINGTVDFNSIYLLLSGINFDITGMTLIYHCGSNVYSEQQTSATPAGHNFTGLTYATGYDCWAEVIDNTTSIMDTTHKTYTTTQPITYTFIPQNQSVISSITGHNNPVATVEWSITNGVSTITQTQNALSTITINGLIPNEYYTYTGQCYAAGHVAEGNPITGSFRTKSISGILQTTLITNESATLSVSGLNIIEAGTYTVKYSCNGIDTTYTFTNNGIPAHAVSGLTGNTAYPISATIYNGTTQLAQFTGTFTTDRDWKVTLANNSPHDIAITPTYYPARYVNYYYQVVFYYNNSQIGQTLRTLFTTNTSVANLVPKISGNFKYSAYVYDAAVGGTLIDSIENVTYTPQEYTMRFTAQDSEYVSFKIGGFPANYIQTLNLTIKKSGATVKTETVNVAAADTQVIKTYNDLLYGTYTVQYSVVWEGYTVASGSSTYKSTVLPITYTNRATDDTITATVNSMTSQATRVTITVDGETKILTEPGSAIFNDLTASTTYPIIYRIYNNNTLLETLNLSIRTAANGGYINVSNIDYDAADVILMNPKLAHSENMEGYTVTYRGIGSPVTVPIDYITRGQKQHYSGLTANRDYHIYADLKYNNNLVSTFDTEFTTATLYTLTTDSTSTTATAEFDSMPYTHNMAISATLNGVTNTWTRNRGDYTESFTPVWAELTRNTDYTLTYTITVDGTVVETGSRTIHTKLYDYKLVQEWENTQLKIAVNDLTANTSSSVLFTVTATDFSFTQTVITSQTYTGWVLPHQGTETTEAGIHYNISAAVTENGTTYTLTDTAYLASPYDIKIEQKNQAISTRISGLYTDLTGYSMDMTIKSADNTTTLDYLEYEIPANTYDTGDIYNHADVSLIPKTYYVVEVHLYRNGYLIAEKTQTICFAFEYEVDASYNDNNRLYVELNWYRPYQGYYVTANISGGATQVQLLSYSNRATLIFDSLDTTIDQTLNLAFYDQYNTLIAQESKRIRAKSENVDITVEAVDDIGNVQCYASPVPSAVTQITWIISAGDAVVSQATVAISSTDHQSSPIHTWIATSNTEYTIKCVMSNGQTYTKHYTTPLFGYGMDEVEFELYTFATQLGFSMYNASQMLTYDYGAYLDGRAVGELTPFTVDNGGGAYYKMISGLLPSTHYEIRIHCYDDGQLVYTYTLLASTKARGRVYAQWSGNYALVYLDDMNQESGSVIYHSENQTSAQISFTNIDMGAQASLILDSEKSHTIYADVTFTTNGITYHDTFTTELQPLITYNVRARLDLENSRYPILQVWNEYDTDTHTILADVKLRCASDNRLTWQFSRTLTNYDEFKSDTALYPDDYILSYRIYEGANTLLQDDIRFSADDWYEDEYLDAEGYETSVYAKLECLKYERTYNITYRLVGENVNRTMGPYNTTQCYYTEPVIFTNVAEEGDYVLYAEYYISGDNTLHVLSRQVVWDQSNSIYGNDELKIIPHAVSEDDLVVEATGSFIDDYTDYNLKWSLYDAGLQVKSAEQNYDVAMPHPYSVFNDLPLDKRYDIVLDYTGNDGAIQRRRKSYMYFGSLGHFEYFEINQCLYITYIGPTDAYATVLLTNPKRKPLTATINDGMTYQLEGIQPNTTYTVKAVINSDTTHQKLGEINETYTTLNYLRLTAQTGQSETSVVATVTNIRQGFAPCYIKFTIRKSGSIGTAAIDEYQESSLIYTTYSTLPSYTFSNLNAGTTYDIRAELYINQDFYGYESILYKTASAAPAAWTWLTNNGSWTVGRLGRETYTVDSKSALDGTDENRRVCLFHSEVWNDMCEKVRDMLWYLGETWDNEYLPYDETIMTNTWGYILTAQRYRSLWTQVINHINTPGIHHDILAQGCNVYATYITDLMQFVNDWISSGVSSFYSQEYDPLAQILARWKSGSTLTQTEIDINTQRNTSIDLGLVRGRKFETADALTTWLNFKRA